MLLENDGISDITNTVGGVSSCRSSSFYTSGSELDQNWTAPMLLPFSISCGVTGRGAGVHHANRNICGRENNTDVWLSAKKIIMIIIRERCHNSQLFSLFYWVFHKLDVYFSALNVFFFS